MPTPCPHELRNRRACSFPSPNASQRSIASQRTHTSTSSTACATLFKKGFRAGGRRPAFAAANRAGCESSFQLKLTRASALVVMFFFVLARREKSRSRMIDGVFLNMVGVIGRGKTCTIGCEGRSIANHAITAIFHERHKIARGFNLWDLEARENIDRFFAEFTRGGNFIGHGKAVVTRRLMGETAHNACDGMNGAPANERAQLIAQRLNSHSAIEKLGRRFRKGKALSSPSKSGAAKRTSEAAWFLKAAIHEQFAQNARALARLHAKDLLNRKQIGYHVARRANSANTRGDIARLGEGASSHHRLE